MSVPRQTFDCACCGKTKRGPRITIQRAGKGVVLCPECRFDDQVFDAIMATSDADVLAGKWPEIVQHATSKTKED